jgi:hypothetical protein
MDKQILNAIKNLEKRVVDLYYRVKIGNSTPGPIGPQGVQGIAGLPGPIGPAGLTWQGSWTSGVSYVKDNAVGYGGASYFCILATSGTTTPNLDTTHWALLASQGAVGPTGVQGPTGAQGPQGINAYKSYVASITQTELQNPIQNVVFNDTGVSIVWTRSTSGNYLGTVSASFFDTSKVVIFTSSTLGGDFASTIMASAVDANLLQVLTLRVQGGGSVLADDLFNCFIEVRVYN